MHAGSYCLRPPLLDQLATSMHGSISAVHKELHHLQHAHKQVYRQGMFKYKASLKRTFALELCFFVHPTCLFHLQLWIQTWRSFGLQWSDVISSRIRIWFATYFPPTYLSITSQLPGVQEKLCFPKRIFSYCPASLPSQHWAPIGLSENCWPLGVTLFTAISCEDELLFYIQCSLTRTFARQFCCFTRQS